MSSVATLRMTELMWDALRSKHGLLVRVLEGNVASFKIQLYSIRKQNPEMAVLHLEQSSDPNTLYITKRT